MYSCNRCKCKTGISALERGEDYIQTQHDVTVILTIHYLTQSYPILSYLLLSYPIFFCPVLSYPVLFVIKLNHLITCIFCVWWLSSLIRTPLILFVQTRVDRINSMYGDGKTVVYFEERKEKDMRLAQRLAFFAGSDVLMITPTRY